MYRDNNQRDFSRKLRNESSPPEQRLWHFLRAQKLRGRKFRRQAAIGAYVVDFVCFSIKLIIELDGPQHLEARAIEHDARRTEWLTARGYHVLRFRNQELDEHVHAVVEANRTALAQLETRPEKTPLPSPPRRG